MQSYADILTDQWGAPVPGARVVVLGQDGNNTPLYDSAGTGVSNPVLTGADGAYAFSVADDGLYTLQIFYGGRMVQERQLPLGYVEGGGGTGAPGAAATIAVGAVTTGAAGSNVTVVNSGTTSAAVFDFSIPRGAVGPKGDKGDPGVNGVSSVNTRSGAVTLAKDDVGLGAVDNTSDANKPVSSAQQTALNAKEPTILAGSTDQWFRGDKTFVSLTKADVGLNNVNNTADANKPISTATATALSLKAPLASPALTGTPTAPTAALATNNTQVATTAFVAAAVAAGGGGGGTPGWAGPVTGTGTGAAQNFTLPESGLAPHNVLVRVNGISQHTSDYSISGTTLTLTTNAAGDAVEIVKPAGAKGDVGPANVKGFQSYCSGQPLANERIAGEIAPYAWTINPAQCAANAGSAATASAVLTISQNGANIGTVTFAAGASSGALNFTATAVADGDILRVTAPASQDATLADISILLRA